MRQCLKLAQKGEGRVSPNPLVGALVVKGGKIIGRGFHEKFGCPHAEANAFSDARRRGHGIKGATIYVSLEPCSHTGHGKKTPPCAQLLARSGVSRVVIACPDPNPRVDGRGISLLKKALVKVEVGLLRKEAEEQNGAFIKHIRTGRPFFLVKLAQSANGKIGVAGKSRVWLSSRKFDSYCHLLRNRYDGILVGINTVLADDPKLTCRMKGGRNPARIILDSNLSIPLTARVLSNSKKESVLIFTAEKRGRAKQKALAKLGAKVIVCGKSRVDLKKLASLLPSYGVYSVLVEGGAQTVASFARAKLADWLVLAISPKRIADARAIPSPFTPAALRSLTGVSRKKMGQDRVIEGRISPD